MFEGPRGTQVALFMQGLGSQTSFCDTVVRVDFKVDVDDVVVELCVVRDVVVVVVLELVECFDVEVVDATVDEVVVLVVVLVLELFEVVDVVVLVVLDFVLVLVVVIDLLVVVGSSPIIDIVVNP